MAASAVRALQSRLTQSIFELVSPFLKLAGAGDLAGLPVPERFSRNKRHSQNKMNVQLWPSGRKYCVPFTG
jgi:hypothetical protein